MGITMRPCTGDLLERVQGAHAHDGIVMECAANQAGNQSGLPLHLGCHSAGGANGAAVAAFQLVKNVAVRTTKSFERSRYASAAAGTKLN